VSKFFWRCLQMCGQRNKKKQAQDGNLSSVKAGVAKVKG
jgi:hypothetical protein